MLFKCGVSTCSQLNLHEKTADIWWRLHWFPRVMTSEKQAQKFHTDDVSLPTDLGSTSEWLKICLN